MASYKENGFNISSLQNTYKNKMNEFISDASIPTSSDSGASSIFSFLLKLCLVLLLIAILVRVLFYFFPNLRHNTVTAYIQNIFTNHPEVDVVIDHHKPPPPPPAPPGPPVPPPLKKEAPNTTVPQIMFQKQVFNIPGNTYSYENAKAVCAAYGASLANYDQVEKAYKKGAEWCNYGWSDGQMILFPTQQSTFERLQHIPGHEHDCGRPGINGGFVANPDSLYGVNCYGNKPKINEEERKLMENVRPYPETIEDIKLEKQIEFWRNRISQILVSPFNYEQWGQGILG
jgi:hypothetical protein